MRSEGEGPALVLIHGVGLRAEAWAAMTPMLSARFSVHALDLPGHGASPLGTLETLEDYVDAVKAALARFEAPVYLAGHSMGAIIAMKLAARRGAQVAGMAALNAIYRRTPQAEQAVKARAAAILSGAAIDNAPTLARWFGAAPTGAMKTAADLCGQWLHRADRQGYGRAYAAFAAQDGPTEDELRRIAGPALFMTGARDPNSTPAMSEAMAALAPQGRAVSLVDAAHMMTMTHPGAVAEALIDTFLSGAA